MYVFFEVLIVLGLDIVFYECFLLVFVTSCIDMHPEILKKKKLDVMTELGFHCMCFYYIHGTLSAEEAGCL